MSTCPSPTTRLARPTASLMCVGAFTFVRWLRSQRRVHGLYRLDDPFLLFWYRFVAAHRSRTG